MKLTKIIAHEDQAAIIFDDDLLRCLNNPEAGDELDISFVKDNHGASALIRNLKPSK